jgi:16S rRNA processing protein RimM
MSSLPAQVQASALPPDAVEVARVLGAWGVKGGLKIKAFSADPQALFSTKRWFLLPPETPRPVGIKTNPSTAPFPPLLRVTQAREQGDTVVATVQEVDDRDQAEALRGARVFVARTSFPTPGDGEFYWIDLIGMAVSNREGVLLGKVEGLIETGPHCVLTVHNASEPPQECLIPFVDAYVDAVDMPGRRITVDWQADY